MVSKSPKLKDLIPDKTCLTSQPSPNYIYAIHFPQLDLIKIGESSSNPWSRLRDVARSVRNTHGESALTGLRYAIKGGHYQDEQELHEGFKLYRCYQPGLTAPTEWFHYSKPIKRWFEERLRDVRESSVPQRYIRVRKSARRLTRERCSFTRPLYVPAD